MRNKLLILILVLIPSVCFAQVYVRDDGGTPIINGVGECDGTVDAPKSADKHCAYSSIYREMTADQNKIDDIIIGKGTFAISIRRPPVWISMTEFIANPKKYTDMAKSGRPVYINNYNGRVYEITLKY